jgi:hypothetical protein
VDREFSEELTGLMPDRPRLADGTALADRFLMRRASQSRTPSAELVTQNPKPRHGSVGSDDRTMHNQLKMDTPVKLDGPVDE